MPSNIVKTKADEKKWRRAKALAAESRGDLKGDRKWAYVNSIF